MNKEMFISSSPHETKVGVCEDGQLVEVYFERDTDVGLVGGIYKGRVSRVLPGMQSAFVDIGLERDAFLYVSDFSLQEQDEFEGVLEESQKRGGTIEIEPQASPAASGAAAEGAGPTPAEAAGQTEAIPQQDAGAATSPEGAVKTITETSGAERRPEAVAGAPAEETSSHRRSHRGRRRRRHGRGGYSDRRHGHRAEAHGEESPAAPSAPEPAKTSEDFEILPGESLAKYSHHEKEDSSSTEPAAQTADENFSSAPVQEEAKPETPEREVDSSADPQSEETTPEVERESKVEAGDEQPEVEPEQAAPSVSETASAEEETEKVKAAPETAESPADKTKQTEGTSTSRTDSEYVTEEETEQPGESASEESSEDSEQEVESASNDESEAEEKTEGSEEVSQTSEKESDETGERSAELREPHARPRVAPRRGRRGRRRTSRHSRRHVSRESSHAGNQPGVQISELLKEGQEIIVQIAKEPLGTKGARITSHVALPGRYVVYMPTISHIGVSRKISSEQERLRLRNIILENRGSLAGGFIVRTAGEGRSEEEIKADLRFLTTLWNEIRNRAEKVKAPALLYRDLDLAQRLMRDLVTPDYKSIWLDNESDYEKVVEFMSRLQPTMVGNVKLHTRPTSLFEEHGIQEEIEKALRPKVWLKSGGYIVINQTEALIAIDVNTGKYVGKTNRLEDTIVKTNIDAVNEIVRQIRLRDLGGIIVIDFIDMDERRNRNKVIQALEEALRRDRAPTKVLSFNDFGLVAVTRKRVKQSLERTLCDPCTYCSGSGWVKSVATVCYEIVAEARKMADEIEGKTLTLRVNPDVAIALKSKDESFVSEIEGITHKNLVIKSDPTIHQERFEIF